MLAAANVTAPRVKRSLGRNRRGIFRPSYVARDDFRSPMLRLLQDNIIGGIAQPDYAQQWPTICKAVRLGYLDDRNRLTADGADFLISAAAKAEGGV